MTTLRPKRPAKSVYWYGLGGLVFVLILVAAHILIYDRIYTDLKQIRQSLSVGNSELESPSSHAALRAGFISTQLLQAKGEIWIVLGDSIVEGMYLPRIGAYPVLNAGIGGGGVITTLELVRRLPTKTGRIAGIVLAVGVNDAQRSRKADAGRVGWRRDYLKLLSVAAQKFGGQIVICTIFPVERDKPLGEAYFDPAVVAALNDDIRSLAGEKRLVVADLEREFSSWQGAGGYTTDGVHLTPEGYERWSKAIITAVTGGRIKTAPQ